MHYNNNNQYENPYGKLYNWFTVNDSRNLCPTDWHVPSDTEWTVLSDYLGGESVAGSKMKSTGTQYWLSLNTDATNESGFSGLPGGQVDTGGPYEFGNNGYWWSATEYTAGDAWGRVLYSSNGSIYKDGFNKWPGCSVRCLRD